MNSKRLYFTLLGSIILLGVGLVIGTLAINKILVSESNKLVSLKAKSQALAQEQVSLTTAKKDVAKYSGLEKITRAVVPEDKNQAEIVREIVNIAAANGIKLGSIDFPASTLGGNGAATASTPAATTAAPATTGTATIANIKAGDLSQLQPVKNIPKVYLLTVNVKSDSNQPVQYSKFISFLSGLERSRRTAQVSSITLQPDSKNRNLLTFTLTLNGYIKP